MAWVSTTWAELLLLSRSVSSGRRRLAAGVTYNFAPRSRASRPSTPSPTKRDRVTAVPGGRRAWPGGRDPDEDGSDLRLAVRCRAAARQRWSIPAQRVAPRQGPAGVPGAIRRQPLRRTA